LKSTYGPLQRARTAHEYAYEYAAFTTEIVLQAAFVGFASRKLTSWNNALILRPVATAPTTAAESEAMSLHSRLLMLLFAATLLSRSLLLIRILPFGELQEPNAFELTSVHVIQVS
jgi:hypothetical protein